MEQIEFNLVEEPWIRVLKKDGTVQEVSLTDALLHAHEFQDLAGELPTQDVAVLRLLLAVLQTVFYRMDEEGREMPLQSSEEALSRWKILWDMGSFPEKPIRMYLNEWKERFWLFHPERPFYQISQAKVGTEYGAAKLNGEISESGNKVRLFASYSQNKKATMTYAQAARWLLYINGFDDKSGKTQTKGVTSLKFGWLAELGILFAQGANLAETLLLNLTLLREDRTLWEPPLPCWELEQPRCEERTQIAWPNNAAELLTLQSRRLLLKREDKFVVGYSAAGGDFFFFVNAFFEPMTIWKKAPEKKNSPEIYQPKPHDPSKQFWREFPSAFPDNAGHMPGVVDWITILQNGNGLERQQMIHFKSVGITYDKNKCSVTDTFSDTLTLQMQLLNEMGRPCRKKVIFEIQNCEKLAEQIGKLAKGLALAAGNEGVGSVRDAKEQFYFEIDQPFRQWLYQLDPEKNVDAAVQVWREQAKKIACRLGRTMVEEAGTPALVGRSITVKGTEQKLYYSAPKAYQWFLYEINRIYQ